MNPVPTCNEKLCSHCPMPLPAGRRKKRTSQWPRASFCVRNDVPDTRRPRRRADHTKKNGAESAPFFNRSREGSASLVPVAPVAVPASVTLDPSIRYPMPVPVGPHAMALDPDISVPRPVPVSRRPLPSRPDHWNHLVSRRGWCDTHVDVCRRRRGNPGCERARCKTEGKQRVALVHVLVLADCTAAVLQQSRPLRIGFARMSM